MFGSLRKTVEHDYQEINKFFEARPEIYEILDAMIVSVRGPIMATVDLLSDGCSTFRHMRWRTMYDYTETSLLLLLRTRIDEGYALLRMAAELARGKEDSREN